MTDTKLTPKDFANPLLQVLARLSEYEAGTPVVMTDTYKPVCKLMGIDEDFGGTVAGGYKFTHRNIGLAFRQHVRGKQLGEQARRGEWTLTEAGIDAAKQLSGPSVQTEQQAARADATAENMNQSTDDTQGAEVLRLPVAGDKHPYSDDPYLMALAIESVSCFGAWSGRSKVCAECPLARECVTNAGVRKGQIAAELEKAEEVALDQAIEASKEVAQKDRSVDELIKTIDNEEATAPEAGTKGKFKPSPGLTFRKAKATCEGACIQCKGKIPKGSAIMWCKGEGVFHPECFDDSP